jgi:hypothetical protein
MNGSYTHVEAEGQKTTGFFSNLFSRAAEAAKQEGL